MMKLTQVRTDKKNKQYLRLLNLSDVMDAMRSTPLRATVDDLRSFVQQADAYMTYQPMYRLPVVYPSVAMHADTDGHLTVRAFSGRLTLTVGPLLDVSEADAVKQAVLVLPSTVAAFAGSSGRTVKVIVSVAGADGTLPRTVDEAERFCRRAYPLVSSLYEVIVRAVTTTACRLTVGPAVRKDGNGLLMAGFRMTVDEAPLCTESPVALRIPDILPAEQPAVPAPPVATVGQPRADAPGPGAETRRLISLLESHYTFRMNMVMGYVEYRSKEKWHYGWQPVDERVQNGMAMEARLAGLDVWDKDVTRYLRSNLVRMYNPIEEYLWQLRGKWDGCDHIGRLARTVPTDNPYWPRWFQTWLLGMVVQWLGRNPRYGNAVAPLLISRQGYNKSTFCKSLIPRELQWGYNDNLVLSEKKSVLQAMSQFLLINLDEFNQISPKVQEGFLKNLIQLASVKVKRPYGKHVEDMPRRASFIATANVTDLLADPTGNRRFIGIELTGPIDVSQPVDHRQLYAQAMALIDRGEPYWLDEEQTRLVMQSNEQFQLRSPAEQYFQECFALPDREGDGQWMTVAAIFQCIKRVAGSGLRLSSLYSLGHTLSNMSGLQRRRTRKGTEYLVVPLGA